ncbi:MAG: branched-chain amino acid ABC transporter permease [Lachnospiraceae bacterium]|nr:branched-chain amino acid ABC transporter permease [Lachnospiraceae bacterium]
MAELSMTVREFYEKYKKIILAAGVILCILLPFFIQSGYMNGIFCRILFYGTMAGALNVINGYSGQMCLGVAGFFAIGSYTEAILSTRFGLSMWACILLSGVISMLFGVILALPAKRLSGIYLSIITLGFSEVIRVVCLNWTGLTGGTSGIKDIPAPTLFGFVFSRPRHYFYIFLVLGILFLICTKRVVNSRIGRAWMSVREDELAARSLGVESGIYKITAFMYGTFWIGVIGAVYAPYVSFIDSTLFSLDTGWNVLAMLIIGGQGTLAGPMVGSVVINALTEVLRSFGDWRMVIYALLILVVMWVRPQGIAGASNSVLAGVKRKKESGEKTGEEAEQ